MPSWTSYDAWLHEVEEFQRELRRSQLEAIARKQAERAQAIFKEEARKDVGSDLKFSNWKPELETHIVGLRSGVGALLSPTRTGAGPITVAERGRHNDGSGLFLGSVFEGPAVNLRTGATTRNRAGDITARKRRRKGKRWNGQTQGWGTATRAVKRFDDESLKVADREFRKVLVKRFDVEG